MPDQVKIVEVGPRDGLQNEKAAVTTEQKVRLIALLGKAGLTAIEAGSFVSPKWVPQMADSGEVFDRMEKRAGVDYPVLTPNMKGLEAALAHGAKEVAIFGAASESFSQRNINCSIAESLERFVPVCARALDEGVRVRGYISCVLGCPYEGAVDPAAVAAIAKRLMDMGCYEISLGDTIGTGTPAETERLIDAVAADVPVEKLAGHFHDTYGQGVANIWAAYGRGVRVFDASIAGLGGCPYAKGATGNVATEDVVYSLSHSGVATGIDMERLLDAAAFASEMVDRPPVSRAGRALLAKRAA
ncbi:MAG: hydroxymethylglutaryl-CoA lyase [Alphaproteobacteria bacterium]|nr:hydroxymethylglutaryl-CoA lyase [Alphaproteobacteria bacterium]MBO6864688.1 hydroxymethylglutaryl-CoA lyase [Alphaproteobacteria bacterium]